MNKKILVLSLAIVFFASGVAALKIGKFSASSITKPENKSAEDAGLILFYSESCPHCKVVENYIEENKIEEKLRIQKKSVYRDANNIRQLQQKASECKIKSENIGVPFIWDNGKCVSGDKDIINYINGLMD